MILLIHCYQITRRLSLSQYDEKNFLSAMSELLKRRFFLISAIAFLLVLPLLNDQINGKLNSLFNEGTLTISGERLKEKKFMILMTFYLLDFVLQVPLNFITRKSRAIPGEDMMKAFRELILLFFFILVLGIIASYHINLFFAAVLSFIPLMNVIFCRCCNSPSSTAREDTGNLRKEQDNHFQTLFKQCFGFCFHPFAVHLIILVAVKVFNQSDRYDSSSICFSAS
jgi:hypothetical protein